MFLTFPQKFRLFYSTNELAEKGGQRGGVRPHIIECQAVVCGHTCFDHRTCIITSAEGQWCCQGSQSFGNGPKIPPHFYPNE